jgi:hypothetical protein
MSGQGSITTLQDYGVLPDGVAAPTVGTTAAPVSPLPAAATPTSVTRVAPEEGPQLGVLPTIPEDLSESLSDTSLRESTSVSPLSRLTPQGDAGEVRRAEKTRRASRNQVTRSVDPLMEDPELGRTVPKRSERSARSARSARSVDIRPAKEGPALFRALTGAIAGAVNKLVRSAKEAETGSELPTPKASVPPAPVASVLMARRSVEGMAAPQKPEDLTGLSLRPRSDLTMRAASSRTSVPLAVAAPVASTQSKAARPVTPVTRVTVSSPKEPDESDTYGTSTPLEERMPRSLATVSPSPTPLATPAPSGETLARASSVSRTPAVSGLDGTRSRKVTRKPPKAINHTTLLNSSVRTDIHPHPWAADGVVPLVGATTAAVSPVSAASTPTSVTGVGPEEGALPTKRAQASESESTVDAASSTSDSGRSSVSPQFLEAFSGPLSQVILGPERDPVSLSRVAVPLFAPEPVSPEPPSRAPSTASVDSARGSEFVSPRESFGSRTRSGSADSFDSDAAFSRRRSSAELSSVDGDAFASTPALSVHSISPVSDASGTDWLASIQKAINQLNESNRKSIAAGAPSASPPGSAEWVTTSPNLYRLAGSKIEMEAVHDKATNQKQLLFKPLVGEKMNTADDFKKYFSSMFQVTHATGNVYHLSQDQIENLVTGLSRSQGAKREEIFQGLKSALDNPETAEHFKKSFGDATFTEIKKFVDIQTHHVMGSLPPTGVGASGTSTPPSP